MNEHEAQRIAAAMHEWVPPPGVWAWVDGYEGTYLISTKGQVFSVPRPRTSGGVLSASADRYGYPKVSLVKDGHQRTVRVHVLVAQAFLGPRPEGTEIRHLDGNPGNPRWSNLAYGTHVENSLDRAGHGVCHNTNKTHCPQGHPYDESNTMWVNDGGSRRCRKCNAVRSSRGRRS